MRMTTIEKQLVNNAGHTEAVVKSAEKLLRFVSAGVGTRHLDVGCGNGAVPLHMAREYGWAVTGLDVDPAQIALAQTNTGNLVGTEFLTGDATQLPFEDNNFDVVSSFRTTHHIPDWQAALAELVRVTKPGGYVVYVDLVFPGVVASVGQIALRGLMGFPTASKIENFIQQNRLQVFYRTKGYPHELVVRKV